MGKKVVVLLTGFPRSAGLLTGICWTKVKVPAIPRDLGAVVTNDYSALDANYIKTFNFKLSIPDIHHMIFMVVLHF